MPADSLAKIECDDRFRASLHLPGFCQVSNETVEIFVIFDQAVEDEPVDIAGCRVLSKDGIEKGSIANRADDQLVDSRVRLIAFQDESGQQKQEEKDWEGEKQSPDSQRKFPFK